MYIAATWLVIELGDWITERFDLPANLTSYVFIAMIVMLPAVALLAYNHGAPGRDRWTRSERIFLPVNVLIAAVAIYLVNPGFGASAATEMMEIADETGQMQTFEVARQGYHQEVIGYFWENLSADDETDWLSYGLPMKWSGFCRKCEFKPLNVLDLYSNVTKAFNALAHPIPRRILLPNTR